MPKEIVYKPKEDPKKIAPLLELKPKFYPTYYEWLSDIGVRIIEEIAKANGSAVIYTVPANKIFYVQTLTVSGGLSAAVGSLTRLYVNDFTKTLLNLQLDGTNANQVAVLNFNIPLILVAGDILYIYTNHANNYSSGSVIGFLVDEKLIKKI